MWFTVCAHSAPSLTGGMARFVMERREPATCACALRRFIARASWAHPALAGAAERFLVARRGLTPCPCSAATLVPAWEPGFNRLIARARAHPAITQAVMLLALLCLGAIDVAGLVYPPVLSISLLVSTVLLFWIVRACLYVMRAEGITLGTARALTAGLTNLAVRLAGRKRAHLQDAWRSDLDRPRDLPEGAPGVSGRRKLIYAAGLVKAAVRYRMDDAAVLWWQLADGVLASRAWSRLLLAGPCTMAAVMIINREGFYGLVINAENLLAISSASAGLVYGGRKLRKVTPKTAQQKQART
jgi:hypothetical protein